MLFQRNSDSKPIWGLWDGFRAGDKGYYVLALLTELQLGAPLGGFVETTRMSEFCRVRLVDCEYTRGM